MPNKAQLGVCCVLMVMHCTHPKVVLQVDIRENPDEVLNQISNEFESVKTSTKSALTAQENALREAEEVRL